MQNNTAVLYEKPIWEPIATALDNFYCHLDTPGKEESDLGNFLSQIGLWTYLWDVFSDVGGPR